jgi:hypothetical protein
MKTRMEKLITICLAVMVMVAGFAHICKAVPVEWSFHPDNLVHYYDLIHVTEGINWNSAKQTAEDFNYMGVNGYLATITSPSESTFIAQLASQADPAESIWVGGFQPIGSPEPAGNWQWVTGELWDYTNWNFSEPSNHPPNEDALELRPENYGDQWNDESHETIRYYYIVEYSVPEPATILLLALGGLVLRKHRR